MRPSLADVERLVDEVDIKSFMLHYHIKSERDKALENINAYNIAAMVKGGLDKKWQQQQEKKAKMTAEKWLAEIDQVKEMRNKPVNKNGMGI